MKAESKCIAERFGHFCGFLPNFSRKQRKRAKKSKSVICQLKSYIHFLSSPPQKFGQSNPLGGEKSDLKICFAKQFYIAVFIIEVFKSLYLD